MGALRAARAIAVASLTRSNNPIPARPPWPGAGAGAGAGAGMGMGMALDDTGGLNSALSALAERLRGYHASTSSGFSWKDEDGSGGVASSVGGPEAVVGPVTGSDKAAHTGRKKVAAVLICLFQDEANRLRVILTKRSDRLSSHPGEVALPGGKMDEGDVDIKATALREAQEEIGLPPSSVRVVAKLETFLSKHLLSVTPVVALLPDRDAFRPLLNEAEVADIFDAPLDMFLADRDHRSTQVVWLDMPYVVHHFDYHTGGRDFEIWGLTAAILIRAASIVLGRQPDFPEFSPSPSANQRELEPAAN